MSTDKGTSTPPEQTAPLDAEASPVRRRLLKAALGAAPFALTLRSGATLATVSAYECINNDRGRVTRGQALDAVSPTPDMWERVTVKKHQFTGTRTIEDTTTNPPTEITETITEYRYLPPGSPGYYVFSNNKLESADLPVGNPPWTWTDDGEMAQDPVHVLVFWKPSGGDTDVYPADPQTLIHPAYRVDQVTAADFDALTPLTGSCMCSLNPDFTGCHG